MNKDNKKFVIETLFLKEALKQNLNLNEFIVLMYFDNEYEMSLDVKKVAKATGLKESDVLASFGSLLDKKIITLNSVKNDNGKLVDKVSLENLYKGIKQNASNEVNNRKQQEFFSAFQSRYGKSLSSGDYGIIEAWLNNGFNEEIILEAVDEGNRNGVTSLRYIDKILFEWNKVGIKSLEDIGKKTKAKKSSNLIDTVVLDYDWLDEN